MQTDEVKNESQPLPLGAVIGSSAVKHKWSRPMKSFCDSGSYCLNCGLQREKHGLLGTWYINDKTKVYGFAKQPCTPEPNCL